MKARGRQVGASRPGRGTAGGVAAALVLIAAGGLVLSSAPVALAVSDGNYSPPRQHCSGHADYTADDQYTEDGCNNYALTVSDIGGHEYFGVGSPQTANGEQGFIPPVIPFGTGSSEHAIAYWYDLGPAQGGCVYTKIDLKTNQQTSEPCPWFNPAAPNYYGPDPDPDPTSGLRLYNGADDNLAGGEHDSATTAANGPSDGGAIQVNVDLTPASLMRWIGYVSGANTGKVLVHPLPVADAGIGACADGFCVSGQTTRRDRAYPAGNTGAAPNYQPVADYSTHTWDPYNCSNDDQQCIDSGGAPAGAPGTEQGANGPGYTAAQWDAYNGDPSQEPGVQIYEDPDAQGSPAGPLYPIPAIYVGTCGVIVGGGALNTDGGAPQNQSLGLPPTPQAAPGAPYINGAGQLVIPTGCDETVG